MHEIRRNAETRVSVIVNPCENGRIADPRLPMIVSGPPLSYLFTISHLEEIHM